MYVVAISDFNHQNDEKREEQQPPATGFSVFALLAPLAIVLVLGMYMR